MDRWLDSHFVGNHPALDFVNTLSHRVDPSLCEDRMVTVEDLRSWAERAGLRPATEAIQIERQDHGARLVLDARVLREAAHEALLARVRKQDPSVSAIIAIVEQVKCIRKGISFASPSDIASCSATIESDESLLGVIALQILDALFRLPVERLGTCPACGWMFLDVTRGGRRRWCSMATCGNRAKVRRHRGQSDNPPSARSDDHG